MTAQLHTHYTFNSLAKEHPPHMYIYVYVLHVLSSKGRDGVGRAMAGASIWFLLYVHDRAGRASPASKGSATPEVFIMRFGPGICSAALLTEFF